MTLHGLDFPQFFLTAPAPCPYLKGKRERKIFTHVMGDQAIQLNNMLSAGGFRRSQTIAYKPACDTCSACVSVRVLVDEFSPSRSYRRILKANRSLIGAECATIATSEQYRIFRDYIDTRHADGGMGQMSAGDYTTMVEDNHVDSMLVEYRQRGPDSALTGRGHGDLIAVALTDFLSDGLSMVYSYFDPAYAKQSIGIFMILDHIERARRMGMPFVYLGYWVNGSANMSYKLRFQPQEHLKPSGWTRA